MLVVTTPTGQIGRQVLDSVLDRGPVRVLVRDPARLPARVRSRAEVVTGSLDDVAAVTAAFAGASAVFWLVPPAPDADSVEGRALEFTRPLCEALTRQGVPRLVYVTGLRGDGNSGHGAAARAMDELIGKTGVSYRDLRVPALMENMLQQLHPIRTQGVFFLPVSGDRRIPTCATRDIAAVAARLLLDESWRGPESVPLLGAEDLSYEEMAGIMSDVLGRPIRYQRVPGEAYRARLTGHGMSEAAARALVDLLSQVDRGAYNAEPRTPGSTTPTTFRQWCEEVLRPAVLA